MFYAISVHYSVTCVTNGYVLFSKMHNLYSAIISYTFLMTKQNGKKVSYKFGEHTIESCMAFEF